MQVKIFKNYSDLSQFAASIIIHQVKEKPNSVLCFASGDTPRLTLEKVVDIAKKEGIDFSGIQFIGLDEWVGISSDTTGSCSAFFHETFLSALEIPDENIHLFDATAHDLEGECKKMDQIIAQSAGIDLMLVGIGMNGHIGFNEPGIPWNFKTHVAELHETTRSVGQKYFKTSRMLTQGITLGFQHLLDARQVMLMANGLSKSPIIKHALSDTISEEIPASIIRTHQNSWVLLDEDAASSLSSEEQN